MITARQIAEQERKRFEKELKKQALSLDFYKIRIEEIEKNIDLFPEPYKTYLCNVLANGKINIK